MSTYFMHILFSAHGRRGRGGRSEPVKLRVVFERLPGDSLHRVQRSPGHLSLLRKQVLLLAGHHRGAGHVLEVGEQVKQFLLLSRHTCMAWSTLWIDWCMHNQLPYSKLLCTLDNNAPDYMQVNMFSESSVLFDPLNRAALSLGVDQVAHWPRLCYLLYVKAV